jgi:hypothetical protein
MCFNIQTEHHFHHTRHLFIYLLNHFMATCFDPSGPSSGQVPYDLKMSRRDRNMSWNGLINKHMLWIKQIKFYLYIKCRFCATRNSRYLVSFSCYHFCQHEQLWVSIMGAHFQLYFKQSSHVPHDTVGPYVVSTSRHVTSRTDLPVGLGQSIKRTATRTKRVQFTACADS